MITSLPPSIHLALFVSLSFSSLFFLSLSHAFKRLIMLTKTPDVLLFVSFRFMVTRGRGKATEVTSTASQRAHGPRSSSKTWLI